MIPPPLYTSFGNLHGCIIHISLISARCRTPSPQHHFWKLAILERLFSGLFLDFAPKHLAHAHLVVAREFHEIRCLYLMLVSCEELRWAYEKVLGFRVERVRYAHRDSRRTHDGERAPREIVLRW